MYRVEYTTTVMAFHTRTVRCAHCGETYLYDLRAQGQGQGRANGGHGDWEAKNAAAARAREAAEAKLAGAIDLVPCPTCGCYQPDMVALLKKQYLGWLFTLGGLALLGFLLTSGLALLVKTHKGPLFVTAGACGMLGSLLLAVRAGRVARYDPNAGDPEPRKQLGQSRAYHPAEADQIQRDRQDQVTAGKRTFEGQKECNHGVQMALGGIVLLGASVFLAMQGALDLAYASESPHWPKAMAKVFRQDEERVRRGQRYTAIGPVIYHYTVDGKPYSSSNLCFGLFQGGAEARKRYNHGQDVQVSYHPQDPSIAVLRPGIQAPYTYMGALWAGVALLCSVLCFSSAVARYRRYQECRRKAAFVTAKLWKKPAAVPLSR